MAIYSLANLTTGTASGAAAIELRTGASVRVSVREVGFTLSAATASTFGLGRPAAIGVTPTSPITLLAQDPAEGASSVQTALAWGTGPTAPTNFFRRISLPGTIGTGIIWTFAKGELVIPVSSSIVLWNLALNSAVNCWFVTDE